MRPRGHLSRMSIYVYFDLYEILRLASVYLHLKEHIENVLLSILRNLAPSQLVFGILRFRKIFGILLKHFDKKLLHDFDVGLLMTVCYPKRSYSPMSIFISG